jgi:hypothetical protein
MAGVNLQKAKERLEKLRKAKEDRKKAGDYMNLESGENMVRFLAWSASGEPFKEAWYHFNFAEKPILCAKKTLGEPDCGACDFVDALFKTKNPDDKAAAKDRMAKVRYFAPVLNMKEKDPKDRKRVRVLSFGTKINEDLLGYFVDEDYGDFTDPETGRDVKIERVGEKLETKYTVRVRTQQTPVQGWEEIKASIPDLDARVLAERKSPEEITIILETGEIPTESASASKTEEEPAAEASGDFSEPASKEDDGFSGETKEEPAKAETKPTATKTETGPQENKMKDQLAKLRARAAGKK